MSYEFYKWLHVSSFALLILSLGVLTVGLTQERFRKKSMILSGIALVLLFISGFGIIAKASFALDFWIYAKLVLWFVLGSLSFFIRRHPSKIYFWMLLIFVLSTLVIGFAVWKPSL